MRIEEARAAIARSLPNLAETDIFAVMNLLQTLDETRGKGIADHLPIGYLESLASDEPPNFWESLMQFRQQLEVEDSDLNPDEVWGDVRDRTLMPIEPQF